MKRLQERALRDPASIKKRGGPDRIQVAFYVVSSRVGSPAQHGSDSVEAEYVENQGDHDWK